MPGRRTPDAVGILFAPESADHDPAGGGAETSAKTWAAGIENVSCWLYEPDGVLLSAGLVQAWDPGAACRVRVVGFDWPGQIVQRCLVGDVREVNLELEWGTHLPAHIEQVRFDPTLGRICELHLVSACRDRFARGGLNGHSEADQPPALSDPQTVGAT